MRLHFSKLCKNRVIADKKFGLLLKVLYCFSRVIISIRSFFLFTLYQGGNIAKDEIEVSRILNNFYINIVKNVTGKERDGLDLNNLADFQSNKQIFEQIKEKYSTHPGIKRIKDKLNYSSLFSFRKATTAEILKIIKALDINFATRTDTIPPKLVVMLSDLIAKPPTNLINASAIQSSIFPSCGKVASVTLTFKKDDRLYKINYRPASVLNVL